ncbi:hypothetical protein N7455_000319 [Penicillium solitum]|uniref:uncharacterized protein n=1 Tax=Penicillium solitum TaxID=60172 RepID=UPI0032C495A9|nr:hypothetical protein N7455_000319 [Penicillium solitum]
MSPSELKSTGHFTRLGRLATGVWLVIRNTSASSAHWTSKEKPKHKNLSYYGTIQPDAEESL